MRKVIKIGFPIICVSVIIGTFILLRNTADKINRNKIEENKTDTTAQGVSDMDEEIYEDDEYEEEMDEVFTEEMRNEYVIKSWYSRTS